MAFYGMYLILTIILTAMGLFVGLIKIACMWHFFRIEGRKGWYSLVPFYNMYQQYDLFWIKGLFWFDFLFSILLPILPVVLDSSMVFVIFLAWFAKFIMRAFLAIQISKHYKHGIPFGIGMICLPVFFYPYLAITTY